MVLLPAPDGAENIINLPAIFYFVFFRLRLIFALRAIFASRYYSLWSCYWLRCYFFSLFSLFFVLCSIPTYKTFNTCSLICSSSSFISTTIFCISLWFDFEPSVFTSLPISWAINPSFLPGDFSCCIVSTK